MLIFILGSTGMLGHQVCKEFDKRKIKYVGLNSTDFDFRQESNILSFAKNLQTYDLVINCCGMIRQRMDSIPSATTQLKYYYVNSFLPQYISERCNLIHISTDCVFSGKSYNKLYEDTIPDPSDIYGRTKLLGEPLEAVTIRTSFIGKEISGRNLGLYEWFMRQKKAQGYTNHYWNGITTNCLAKILADMVQQNRYQNWKNTFHLFNPTILSKCQLLETMSQYRSKPIKIEPLESNEYIQRTLYTIHPRFKEQFNIPPIEEQIKEMMQN